MLDLPSLIVASAHAADAAPPANDVSSSLMKFLPLFLIFGVFYFLLIRPQQKKLDEQTAMIKALKKGDRVVTAGGIIGTIASLEGEDYVMLEVADGVKIKVVRSTINSLFDGKKVGNDNKVEKNK